MEIEFEKKHSGVAKKPITGKWYYGFSCLVCKKQLAVFDDPSQGRKPITFTGSGHIQATCQECGNVRFYSPAQVQQFQAV
jgi:hypothetical protein